MPTSTDLVTDLPADFEVFGQAVDTSLADLKGGTTNQVLAKNSNTDMDFKWVADAAGMTNPMTTTGDIIYSSPGSTPVRLGIGSTGNLLTVAGGVPTWAAPAAAGGMTLISETVASGLSSLSLSSIPGTYKQLLLVWSGIYHSDTSTSFNARFNNDSGNNYSRNIISFTNATVSSSSGTDNEAASSVIAAFGNSIGTSSTNLVGAAKGTLFIDNYSSSTKLKFYRQEAVYLLSGGDQRLGTVTGVYNSTSAITSIDIYRGGAGTFSNITNTSIRLYGIS
jgi:hypothetical protein